MRGSSIPGYDHARSHVRPSRNTALLQTIGTDLEFFRSRAILCFRNDTVSEINADLLNLLGGETRIYHSVDRTDIDDAENGRAPLPQEFLRSLEPASLPPARLYLKVGAPIMLLRNLYPAEGLCNGTRLLVTRLGERCIQCSILGGVFHGQIRVIPRIKLSTTEDEAPWIITQRQLQVRLCFAITVKIGRAHV